MCTSLVGRGHLEPWPLSGFATQRVWVSELAGYIYPLPFCDLNPFDDNYNIPSFALRLPLLLNQHAEKENMPCSECNDVGMVGTSICTKCNGHGGTKRVP